MGRNKQIFNKAKQYLLNFPEINEQVLKKNLEEWKGKKVVNLKELFKKMAFHAQNKQGMPNSIGDIEKISPFIYNWDFKKVNNYYSSWENLFDNIQKSNYNPPGRMVKNNPHNYWVQFCKSILSISAFVSRFKSISRFNEFVEVFYFNEETRIALPLLIKEEIFGYQFALACDFLKESGYPEFVKPDTHIRDIFQGLHLTEGANDFQIFRDVIIFSKSINQLPYEVDKLFWLIGSGNFYLNGIKIKTSKKDFIHSIMN